MGKKVEQWIPELPQDYNKLSSGSKRIVREEYVKQQGGRCAYCDGKLSEKPAQEVRDAYPLNMSLFPIGFLKHPVHLHHCHKTGKTISALHGYCNGIMFQYHGE